MPSPSFSLTPESVSLASGDRVRVGARKTIAIPKFFTVQQVADLILPATAAEAYAFRDGDLGLVEGGKARLVTDPHKRMRWQADWQRVVVRSSAECCARHRTNTTPSCSIIPEQCFGTALSKIRLTGPRHREARDQRNTLGERERDQQ